MSRLFFIVIISLLAMMSTGIAVHFLSNPGNERTERVFAYVTLKNPILRSVICGCLVPTSPALLEEYNKQGLTIVPDENSNVQGQIFYVSDWELAWFDRYERMPKRYRREQVEVDGLSAWVYIKN